MTSLNSTPDEPFDPFDRESLLYSAAEVTHGEIDAKHELTAIQLRKPIAETEWFRMHPDADYIWPVATFARVGEKGEEPVPRPRPAPPPVQRIGAETLCGCGWRSTVLAHRSSGR